MHETREVAQCQHIEGLFLVHESIQFEDFFSQLGSNSVQNINQLKRNAMIRLEKNTFVYKSNQFYKVGFIFAKPIFKE